MTRYEAWGYAFPLLAAALFFAISLGLSLRPAHSQTMPVPGYVVVCQPGVVSFEGMILDKEAAKEHARWLATELNRVCYVMTLTIQATPRAQLGPVEQPE